MEKSVDLASYLAETSTSWYIFACSSKFTICTIYVSDDDFNQSLHILNVNDDRRLDIIDSFGLKDEFYKNSAFFTHNEEKLVFVHSTSVLKEDDISADIIYLTVFNVLKGKTEHKINCGEKKFSELRCHGDSSAIISYNDGSFDLYNLTSGTLQRTFNCPLINGIIQDWICTEKFIISLVESSAGWSVIQSCISNKDDNKSTVLLDLGLTQRFKTPSKIKYIEEQGILLTLQSDGALLNIWEYESESFLYTLKVHLNYADNIYLSEESFILYTCSMSECIVKEWDICNTVIKSKISNVTLPMTSDILEEDKPDAQSKHLSVVQTPVRRNSLRSVKSIKSVRFADDTKVEDNVSQTSVRTHGSNEELDRARSATPTPSHASSSHLSEVPLPDPETRDGMMFGITTVVFTQDCKHFVTGYNDRMGTVWNTATIDVELRVYIYLSTYV